MKIIDNKNDIKRPRKRFNKNIKKSWRKHIDISDIDAFQEDQRREERLGGPIEDKSSDDLFSLDVGLKVAENATSRKSKRLAKGISFSSGLKPSRRIKESKILKCHQFINGLQGAKAISKKQGVVKQKPCKAVWAALKISKNTPAAEKKRLEVKTQRKKAVKANRTPRVPVQVDFKEDLWNIDDKKELDMFGEVGKTFMGEPMEYYKVSTNQNKVKVPVVRYQKTSSIPAVLPPKPGASYNPSLEDHQSLLAEAVQQEDERIEKIRKEERMIMKYLPSKKDGITHEQWLQEMSEGLPIEDLEEYQVEDVDEENQDETIAVSGKKLPEKRSKQSRKKAQTLRVKEQLRIKRKETNQLESQVFRVKSYQKEIQKEDQKRKVIKTKEKQKKKERKFETKKLSQHKFKEEDICVPLGNELCSSLRTIEPMSNPLEDRFRNLQRRNILDTRVKLKRKQPKAKKIKKKHLKSEMKEFIDSLLK